MIWEFKSKSIVLLCQTEENGVVSNSTHTLTHTHFSCQYLIRHLFIVTMHTWSAYMVHTLILFLYTLLCVHVTVLACSIVHKVYTVCVCVCVPVLLHEQHVCCYKDVLYMYIMWLCTYCINKVYMCLFICTYLYMKRYYYYLLHVKAIYYHLSDKNYM